MSKRQAANSSVEDHAIWAAGAGLVPVPMFDLVAVTAIQLEMLKQLAELYDVEYNDDYGKMFVASLTGTTVSRLGARIGSSLVKTIPGVGSLLGGLSMSAVSGASTFALGHSTIRHLEEGHDFLTIDTGRLKRRYKEFLLRGKDFVSCLGRNRSGDRPIMQSLQELEELRERDIITEDVFEAKKKEILDRI